jgi:Arc/MetJ-type ribon-helix-helix transcriptional regulator
MPPLRGLESDRSILQASPEGRWLTTRELDTSIPGSYAWGMEVRLTPDQEAFVRQAIASGRLHRPEDAVEEALQLWEERERTRAEILAAVDVAEASLDRGEGIEVTEQSMRELADGVKNRGRTRLEAERAARRW